MKVTVEKGVGQQIQPPRNPPPPSDLSEKPGFPPRKPPRRKCRGGVRLRRESGAPNAKRSSRPETPLLRWKFDEGNEKNVAVEEEKEKEKEKEEARSGRRRNRAGVSSRKLAAGLWRLRLAELQDNVAQGVRLQSGGGHIGASIHCRQADRGHRSPAEDPDSPHSVSGPKHGLAYKTLNTFYSEIENPLYTMQFEPSFQFPNYAMEGATKWDPDGWKASDQVNQIFGQTKPNNDQKASSAKVIAALEAELEQARARISELETDRRSSKKKLEQFLRKLSEERAAWRSREHEKVRAIIDDMKGDVSREKKNRQRLEIVNSKLVNELADAKLSAKRYLQEYEKERKARALIEEVCDELAKEIGEDKAEVEALKRESMKLREEVDEERKMLQMAEVWREERVQMKLIDAKVMLEEKYSQMNRMIADLEPFLNSQSDSQEMKKADFLMQAAASLNIQDVRELTYEPPNSDDIFSVFEDVNFGESNEREVEPSVGYTPASHASKMHTVSPEIKLLSKDGCHRNSDVYMNQSGELEEDASEWETVSHPEDQGSSYSPDGSDPSVNKHFRTSHVSMNGMEWEKDGGHESPIMEISEVDSARLRQLKKVSSISKLWRSCPSNGDNYKIISVDAKNGRLSNGRLSSAGIMSPDHGSAKGCISPQDLSGQWSSPDSGNPHVNRAMKGCIEWPRTAQKNSLKARLLEARMESQKVQLRQVLKHKI